MDRRNEMAYMESILYAQMQAEEKGEVKGRAEGRAEGKAEAEAKAYQEKLESAKRFKEMGLAIEQISIGTGLPTAEIEKL